MHLTTVVDLTRYKGLWELRVLLRVQDFSVIFHLNLSSDFNLTVLRSTCSKYGLFPETKKWICVIILTPYSVPERF